MSQATRKLVELESIILNSKTCKLTQIFIYYINLKFKIIIYIKIYYFLILIG